MYNWVSKEGCLYVHYRHDISSFEVCDLWYSELVKTGIESVDKVIRNGLAQIFGNQEFSNNLGGKKAKIVITQSKTIYK